MTDVMIQDMATKGSATIKCSTAVTKIAVSERRLAVQLQDSLLVYGLPEGAIQAWHGVPNCLCMHTCALHSHAGTKHACMRRCGRQ